MTKKPLLNLNLAIAIIVSIAHFIFLLPFYSSGQYTSDFFLYHSFSEKSLISRDGFSTLFVLIASLPLQYAPLLHLFCLVSISVSMGVFLYFSTRVLRNNYDCGIACLGIISCGIWYYFYGKQFYDFPFSMLSLSLILWLILSYEKYPWAHWALWVLIGFFLSWKSYNIFAAGGLGLLLLLHPFYGKMIFGISVSKINDIGALFSKERFWLILK